MELADERRVLELEQQVQQLSTALVTNRVTSTAIGLVMAEHHLDREQAFAWLVRASQNSNTKLATVALDLIVQAEHDAAGRSPEQRVAVEDHESPDTSCRGMTLTPRAADS